jgi:hypothetical protein
MTVFLLVKGMAIFSSLIFYNFLKNLKRSIIVYTVFYNILICEIKQDQDSELENSLNLKNL